MNLCTLVNDVFGPLVNIPVIGALFQALLSMLDSVLRCN